MQAEGTIVLRDHVEDAVLAILNVEFELAQEGLVVFLTQGRATLSPARLQKLLVDCHNLKVKRLFFFFADRHRHS